MDYFVNRIIKKEEGLTSSDGDPRYEGDKMDPIIDQWLQELVRVALAIAARDDDDEERADGNAIQT